jgi:hypothetical protein
MAELISFWPVIVEALGSVPGQSILDLWWSECNGKFSGLESAPYFVIDVPECKVWRNPLNLFRGAEYQRFYWATNKEPLTYYDMNLSAQDHQTFFTCESDCGRVEYESEYSSHFAVRVLLLLTFEVYWDVVLCCWMSGSQHFKESLPLSSVSSSLRRWRHCHPLKYWKLLAQRQSDTSKKTGIFNIVPVFVNTVELHLSTHWLSGSAWPLG